MMAGTPFLIGPEQIEALRLLREEAARRPVDVRTLNARLATEQGKTAHRDQMTAQTVEIPVAYLVTFSVEVGHPGGAARHLSMSVQRPGRGPLPEVVWMVAQELGFVGTLSECTVWIEDLQGHGKAVNLAQIISPPAGRA